MEKVFNVSDEGSMTIYDLYEKGRLYYLYDTPTLKDLSLNERYEWYFHMIEKYWFTEAMGEALIDAYNLDKEKIKSIKNQRVLSNLIRYIEN